VVPALAVLLPACSCAPVHERPTPPVAAASPQPVAEGKTPAAALPRADVLADARLKVLVGQARRPDALALRQWARIRTSFPVSCWSRKAAGTRHAHPRPRR